MSAFQNKNQFSDRQYIFLSIVSLLLLVYLSRLFYLQIIDEETKISAENNSTRIEVLYPDRGLIFDRNEKLLVFNEVAYDLAMTPALTREFDTLKLIQVLNISLKDFRRQVNKARVNGKMIPTVIVKQISGKTYATLQEIMFGYPGFVVVTRTLRSYSKPLGAHLLGYVGEVNDRVIQNDDYYKMGDYIGISGLERAYEKELRGEKGKRIFLVDKFNRKIESYKAGTQDQAPIVGKDLNTTLDRDLQEYGELLMQHKIGSIVAIEPETGEILALISAPTFDPALLVGRIRGRNYRELANDPLKPLFNRALMAQYPPGSTFKPINALIALQEGVITTTSTFNCQGGYNVGNFHLGCHHNFAMAVEEAVQRSCNAFFCNAFRRTLDSDRFPNITAGYNNWRNLVTGFGIGKKLGSDVFGELTGNIPKSENLNKKHGLNKWKSLWLVSMGIGQGELLLTPFQMANMTATIANRGYYITPHIVKHIAGQDTISARFTKRNYTGIDEHFFEPIVNGMEKVITSGTGVGAQVPGIAVCGKTGTAQNPHGKDHSIFTAFAPKDNPKIAISVYVENGTFGATWAAPIASLMIEKYLKDSVTRPELEKRMIEANLIPEHYLKMRDTTSILFLKRILPKDSIRHSTKKKH
ncbi:MAG: Sporulation-specific penicillin-binding protein [Bacteroidota bacterium]|jgi:penicillin-binding protein 2